MARRVKRSEKPNQSEEMSHPHHIEFDYIKSNLFRVVVADGVFGGVSPNGRNIHMAVFSERRALPDKSVHPLSETGELGKEIIESRQGRRTVIRELEVDLVFDQQTAINFQAWLQDKIQQMNALRGAASVSEVAPQTAQTEAPRPKTNRRKKGDVHDA